MIYSKFIWIKYNQHTIHSYSIVDLNDLLVFEDPNEKLFFENARVKEDGSTWDYAYRIAHLPREVIRWWSSYGSIKQTSKCHDIKNNLTLSLTFRTPLSEVEFNALDFPRDNSGGFIGSIPLPSFGDFIIKKIKDGYKDYKTKIRNGLIVLVSVFGLVVIINYGSKIIVYRSTSKK